MNFFIYLSKGKTIYSLVLSDNDGHVTKIIKDCILIRKLKFGAISGIYAERCGGYAGQIHSGAFLNYENDRVFHTSNLEPHDYDCENEEEECGCPYDQLEYMQENYDGHHLYEIDEDSIFKYLKKSHIKELENIVVERRTVTVSYDGVDYSHGRIYTREYLGDDREISWSGFLSDLKCGQEIEVIRFLGRENYTFLKIVRKLELVG